jgi:flavin-dependent dehydrogenase
MQLNDNHYDLVIVGASFAGLVAARTAAMRGLKVAVIESKRDPGDRVATTGILVKEAAEALDVPHDLTRRVNGVRLYAPSLKSVDLFEPGYFFLTTRTAQLLRWLAREAVRAGARIYCGVRFNRAERRDGHIHIGGLDMWTRYLVGADGGRSTVAKAFGLGRNARFLTGLEVEYEGLDADPRFLHCFLDSRLAPGYLAWVAPGPTVSQVGLAVHEGVKADLEAFLGQARRLFEFEAARVVERRAGRIPCGGLVKPLAAPGVMLIGDAAGMVSPMTGGGIRLAFQFGRRAAQAIADHIQSLGPPPEEVIGRELPNFALKSAMRRALDLAPSNALLNALLATSPMRALARHIYFRRRGSTSLTLAEFEARLSGFESGFAKPNGASRRS